MFDFILCLVLLHNLRRHWALLAKEKLLSHTVVANRFGPHHHHFCCQPKTLKGVLTEAFMLNMLPNFYFLLLKSNTGKQTGCNKKAGQTCCNNILKGLNEEIKLYV